MRYALDWCLFKLPKGDNETASDQCVTACGRISNALEINLLNATASSTYDYCQDPEFLPNIDSCASCYKTVPNQLYLSNCKQISLASAKQCPNLAFSVLNTLGYACQNQPSSVLPFPVKPSDIFTYQPPSNFSDLATTSASSHGISHDARVRTSPAHYAFVQARSGALKHCLCAPVLRRKHNADLEKHNRSP